MINEFSGGTSRKINPDTLKRLELVGGAGGIGATALVLLLHGLSQGEALAQQPDPNKAALDLLSKRGAADQQLDPRSDILARELRLAAQEQTSQTETGGDREVILYVEPKGNCGKVDGVPIEPDACFDEIQDALDHAAHLSWHPEEGEDPIHNATVLIAGGVFTKTPNSDFGHGFMVSPVFRPVEATVKIIGSHPHISGTVDWTQTSFENDPTILQPTEQFPNGVIGIWGWNRLDVVLKNLVIQGSPQVTGTVGIQSLRAANLLAENIIVENLNSTIEGIWSQPGALFLSEGGFHELRNISVKNGIADHPGTGLWADATTVLVDRFTIQDSRGRAAFYFTDGVNGQTQRLIISNFEPLTDTEETAANIFYENSPNVLAHRVTVVDSSVSAIRVKGDTPLGPQLSLFANITGTRPFIELPADTTTPMTLTNSAIINAGALPPKVGLQNTIIITETGLAVVDSTGHLIIPEEGPENNPAINLIPIKPASLATQELQVGGTVLLDPYTDIEGQNPAGVTETNEILLDPGADEAVQNLKIEVLTDSPISQTGTIVLPENTLNLTVTVPELVQQPFKALVKVDGLPVDIFEAQTTFNPSLDLSEGVHTVSITATDGGGAVVTKTLTVEAPKPEEFNVFIPLVIRN